jgi:hypothetical protein
VPRAELRKHVAKLQGGALTGGHASPREGSQCSVDFSCLEDSREKGMRAQPLDLRSRE